MCSLRIETPHMVENAAFGITVNTILPGVIETDRNAVALSNVEFAEKLKAKILMHRRIQLRFFFFKRLIQLLTNFFSYF